MASLAPGRTAPARLVTRLWQAVWNLNPALLGGYTFDRYLAKKNTTAAEIVVLTDRARTKAAATALDRGRVTADAVNFARTVNYAATVITALPNTATQSFKISGSQPFTMHIERAGTNYVVNGVVRQDGRNAPTAQCVVYGVALTIPPSS